MEFENLCLACPTCNRLKANRTSATDPATGETTALFHPQRDRWSEHFAWSADASELVGRTPTGRATVTSLRMNRAQVIRTRKLWTALDEHPPFVDRQ